MTPFTQAIRPLAVVTPPPLDRLHLTGFTGQEGLSRLFAFELTVLAENRTEVPFDKLLGQEVAVRLELPAGRERHFHGICSRIGQGDRDRDFTSYRLELVPRLWLLTRQARSRIFQHLTVPDILKQVLDGLTVESQIQGAFHPRDFVVQYRESDFAFASRLMEEEGIFYFFKHTADKHTLVLANTPQSHPDVPGAARIPYAALPGGVEARIHAWQKVQDLRSSKYTLWDHCFELPHKHLEADRAIQDSVQVGKVAHKLKAGDNGHLEVYDWPGSYAQRFDGVDKGGGDRPADLQKIFEDNRRTVDIRMRQEAAQSLALQGASNCRQLAAGHTFTLERHFNGDGPYVLTTVRHAARNPPRRSGSGEPFSYDNTFTCLPAGLPFSPPRMTPKPVVAGTQTAVVVGPKSEEVFTDKYGRVKVQFHWDREGENDANSSCWVRVAQFWAGKGWGAHFWPRVGHEVVVAFEEGDPDRPLVVGSLYNADHVPPYGLPAHQTRSGIKTRSTPRGTGQEFNELRFEDKKGHEEIYVHAERNLTAVVESCECRSVGGTRTTTVHKKEKLTVDEEGRETIIKEGNEELTVETGSRKTIVARHEFHQVQKGNYERQIDEGEDVLTVGKGDAVRLVEEGVYRVWAKEVELRGTEKITLTVGESKITLDSTGVTINAPRISSIAGGLHEVKGKQISSVAGGLHEIKGQPVMINCS
jgi:type VI secretion system secreted protein VgrG